MDTPVREVYTSRYYKTGNSYAMVLPPDVRERMGLVIGDTLLIRVEGDTILVRKATPDMICSRDNAARILDKLYTSKEPDNGRDA